MFVGIGREADIRAFWRKSVKDGKADIVTMLFRSRITRVGDDCTGSPKRPSGLLNIYTYGLLII